MSYDIYIEFGIKPRATFMFVTCLAFLFLGTKNFI
jgi:hypothetical protein